MLSQKDDETDKLKQKLDAYKKRFGELSLAEQPTHPKKSHKHKKSHKKKHGKGEDK